MSLLAFAAVLAAMLGVFSFFENGREVEFSTQPFLSDEGADVKVEDSESGAGADGGDENGASGGYGIFPLPTIRGDGGEAETPEFGEVEDDVGREDSSASGLGNGSSGAGVVFEGCEGDEVRLSGIEARLFELHNEERASRDLPSLCVRGDLVSSSRLHSEDMIERGYFAHETPEDVDAFERMERAGYTLDDGHSSIKTGENLAWRTHSRPGPGFSDAELVVEGWLDSEGHRRNLLDPEFREVGIGASTGEYRDYEQPATMYTVNFGVRE